MTPAAAGKLASWPALRAAAGGARGAGARREIVCAAEVRDGGLGVWIGDLPPGLNGKDGLMRMHYRTASKRKQAWQQLVGFAMREAKGWAACTRARVIFVRHYAGRHMDFDNAAASFKFVGDGLVRSGALFDDGPEVISEFVVRQVRVDHLHEQGVLVAILPTAGAAGGSAA